LVSCMARCHIVIALCVMHLCFALSWGGGGFEYNPALVPQAQYYPQPNPYAQYPQPYNPMYNQGGNYPYQQQPYLEDTPESFIEENQEPTADTGAASGAADAASTGTTAPAADSTASVQTPQETADSTGSTPTTTSNMDPLDIQLAAALEAVKADMISKGKQVLEEKQWTDDVKAVIEQYTKKISNVYANIEKLKKDMGELYQKKQQIINAQIQKSLTQKLKDSKSDLQTVQAALDKVTNTQMEFEQSKKDIQGTIDSIFTQLSELKGTPTAAGAATGSATGAGASETQAKAEEPAAAETDAAADGGASSEDTDTDIVDRTAEINSKIDTIKSIVSALNKGS